MKDVENKAKLFTAGDIELDSGGRVPTGIRIPRRCIIWSWKGGRKFGKECA
jgi:hypothetical protein